ncbi:MAG: FMN-binding negative transcriptional regulator [Sedimentitalea sp.]
MHPNPIYRTIEAKRNIAMARERAFGVLALSADAGPLISHIPFLLSEDGATAGLHLVRSNPIVRALEQPRDAVIAVSGPDSYISPDWYGADDQVPTWNYIAIHLRGTLERRPQDELHDLLDRQSALFENRLAPKPPWVTEKMTDGVMEKMMRMILPFRLVIHSIDGTWKLNQNKPDDVRLNAADHVDAYGMGSETAVLAALMRAVDSGNDAT